MSTEYRVEYSVQRREDGDEDFVEIGFGSSGAWSSFEQAGYMAECEIQRAEWQTQPGMPDPSSLVTSENPEDGNG